MYDLECRIDNDVRPYFGLKLAKQVTSLIKARLPKPAEATINKDLAFLRRAFRLRFDNYPPLVV
jgi:hypothetical protein